MSNDIKIDPEGLRSIATEINTQYSELQKLIDTFNNSDIDITTQSTEIGSAIILAYTDIGKIMTEVVTTNSAVQKDYLKMAATNFEDLENQVCSKIKGDNNG